MTVPRFFIARSRITHPDGSDTPTVTVTGDDARHISRSLRMRAGEHLVLCDGDGTDYDCIICTVSPDAVLLSVVGSASTAAEPPYKTTVYQALVRGERFDTVVQKSVECGAARIVPYSAERSTVRISPSDAERKRQRWQRIADEAAKQCGRGMLPEVTAPVTFSEAVAAAASADVSLFCYELSRIPLREVLTEKHSPETVSVMIGPEGGFSESEASDARNSGLAEVSLGRRILRTESAAPFVLACLAYEFER